MADADVLLASPNAGEISRYALARVDLAKPRIAAETQLNWMPHVLGPAMVRPGTAYEAATKSNLAGAFVEFYVDASTTALLVLTDGVMRVLVNDVYVTRAVVSSAVTNGGFNTDLTGWTDNDEGTAVSQWAAGGFLDLIGNGTDYAIRDQEITVGGGDANVEHALHILVTRGPIVVQIGTVSGDNSYFEATLQTGSASLAFTPTGNFWIRLKANQNYTARINEIEVEAAGPMEVDTPWATADLSNVMFDQSEDVVFVACQGVQQRRIERWLGSTSNSRSWAVGVYQANDGPFRLANTTTTTMTPSGASGNVNLTSSKPYFKTNHVGALFRLTQTGQTKTASASGDDQFTDEVRVSGLKAVRNVGIVIAGTWTGTVSLEASLGSPGSWVVVKTWTANVSETFNDELDNQIVYYRLGFKSGDYGSGTANLSLIFFGSVQSGICRVTAFTNSTQVEVEVLEEFTDTTATSDWSEGEWSGYRGWPDAVAFHDGRLFWGTGVKIQGSVSDAFHSFDDTVVGDSGPINRILTTGGKDGIRWLLSLQRLIAGTAAQEISIRASAFDEPLTPSAFVARACARRGVARVRAVPVDMQAIYVCRDTQRIYKLIFDAQRGDYVSIELTKFKQEMCAAGVVSIAVQRHPDTRVWFVLGDGTCVCMVYEEDDDVLALVPVTTTGFFERVAVLPGTDEDQVYFIVRRTVGGGTVRYIEKLAKRTECIGGTLSKTIDCHIVYSGSAVTTITGLSALEGCSVVVWGDGKAQVTSAAPKVVSGGQITGLPVAVSNAVIGIAYGAQFKTSKLAYAAEHGTALTLKKRIARIGLVMADLSIDGVSIGRDFSHMTGLPKTYKGKLTTASQVLSAYDEDPAAFNGGWDPDSRVCIFVQSPHCATLMGLVLQVETNEPSGDVPRER